MSTIVMKFGGASVKSPKNFALLAQIVKHRAQIYDRVILVVSAMGETTNHLIGLAYEVNPTPSQRELDMLVTVGERISSSLMSLALHQVGLNAKSFTGSQAGIITSAEHSQAQILDVRPFRLQEELRQNQVLVVAGFQGVSQEREITTLGRGGSDTTAVALAAALKAKRVEFYKEVTALHTVDPLKDSSAKPIPYLSYEEAQKLLKNPPHPLHPRAVKLAAKNNIPLHFKSFKSGWESNQPGSLISKDSHYLDSTEFLDTPLFETQEPLLTASAYAS